MSSNITWNPMVSNYEYWQTINFGIYLGNYTIFNNIVDNSTSTISEFTIIVDSGTSLLALEQIHYNSIIT
jgi:hypothetical protein